MLCNNGQLVLRRLQKLTESHLHLAYPKESIKFPCGSSSCGETCNVALATQPVALLRRLQLLHCHVAAKTPRPGSWPCPRAADRGQALMAGALVHTSGAGLLLAHSRALQATSSPTNSMIKAQWARSCMIVLCFVGKARGQLTKPKFK